MKALPAEAVPEGEGWIYELKLEGYRFLAVREGKAVKLWSRTRNDLTPRFPDVAAGIATLRCRNVTLDGEMVVADAEGRPSFQLLQNARGPGTSVQAYAFDLLRLDGRDLRDLPLTERRAALRKLLGSREASDILQVSPELTGDPRGLLAEMARQGLEGIVAKRATSPYEAGRRSGAWRKIKAVREQEFVIGGYTPPKGSREGFGALAVGFYRDGKLVFAGKVGTGYDREIIRDLLKRMEPLRTETSPFADLPRRLRDRWAGNFSRAEFARSSWVEPALVCQVRFAEWTSDDLLRQPVYLGLRDDKRPREVGRET